VKNITILALDTSSKICSVSLNINGIAIATFESAVSNMASEHLDRFVNQIINDHQLDLKQINAVAIAKGPGSYTGLRISASYAKGLCYSLQIPLIAINTLEGMANQIYSALLDDDWLICPMLDARRMEVYTAMYDSRYTCVKDTEAVILDDIFFESIKQKTILIGDGANKAKLFIKNFNQFKVIDSIYPSAKQIGYLAYNRFLEKKFESIAYFEPLYLKEFLIKEKEKK
jgi:tRNA threonylcarbamoyladenosine biosynthesis protein TsaB